MRLKVAHAHPHGMANQGKLAAGHANEASLARNHTILEDDTRPATWAVATSTRSAAQEQTDMRYRRGSARSRAVYHRSYLPRQTTMRVTYTNYMGPKYHHHMLNTRRMGSNNQCRHRWLQSIERLWVTWWWPPSSYMLHGLYCRCSSDLWTATWNKVETMMKEKKNVFYALSIVH